MERKQSAAETRRNLLSKYLIKAYDEVDEWRSCDQKTVIDNRK